MSEVQIVKTPSGDDLAIIPWAEYKALVAIAEDAADAALLQARRGEPALALEDVLAIQNQTLHPLTAWRKNAGLTQTQLAQRADVRAATISDIERGASPAVAATTLKKLADALGVAVDDVLTDIS